MSRRDQEIAKIENSLPPDEDGDYSGYRETATRIYNEKNNNRTAITKAFLAGGKNR